MPTPHMLTHRVCRTVQSQSCPEQRAAGLDLLPVRIPHSPDELHPHCCSDLASTPQHHLEKLISIHHRLCSVAGPAVLRQAPELDSAKVGLLEVGEVVYVERPPIQVEVAAAVAAAEPSQPTTADSDLPAFGLEG